MSGNETTGPSSRLIRKTHTTPSPELSTEKPVDATGSGNVVRAEAVRAEGAAIAPGTEFSIRLVQQVSGGRGRTKFHHGAKFTKQKAGTGYYYVEVTEIDLPSPANNAGLKIGDVVVEIGSERLDRTAPRVMSSFNNEMCKSHEIDLVVLRINTGSPPPVPPPPTKAEDESPTKGEEESEPEQRPGPDAHVRGLVIDTEPAAHGIGLDTVTAPERTMTLRVSLNSASSEVSELMSNIMFCATTELDRWAKAGAITGLGDWRAADKLVVLGNKDVLQAEQALRNRKNLDNPKQKSLMAALHGLQRWLQSIDLPECQSDAWNRNVKRLQNLIDKKTAKLGEAPLHSVKQLYITYQKALCGLVPHPVADGAILDAMDDSVDGADWSTRCRFTQTYKGFPRTGVAAFPGVDPQKRPEQQATAHTTISSYALLAGFLKALDCSRITSSFVEYKFGDVYWGARLETLPDKAGLFMLARKFAVARPCILYPLVHIAIKAGIDWAKVADNAPDRIATR